MKLQGIDIGTILNKFDDKVDLKTGEVKTYGIKFLKKRDSNNKVTGILRKARKGVKNPKAEYTGEKSERGKFRFNLKSKGTMLLYDEEIKQYRTIKVSCIYAFRDHGSTEWTKRI